MQVRQILHDVEDAENIIGSPPGWYDYKYEYLTCEFEQAFKTKMEEASGNSNLSLLIKAA
jgi:hypothetical protein